MRAYLSTMEGMTSDSSWDVGQQAMEILAPESTEIGLGPDVASIGDSVTAALGRATRNPGLMLRAAATLTAGLTSIPSTVLSDWLKAPHQAKGKDVKKGDRRFSDPAWTENPYFHTVLLTYLSACDFVRTLVDESGLDPKRAAKAKLGLDLMLDALAPSNFLLTNPVALKRAFDTAGVTLLKGVRNFTTDLFQNRGMPRQVDDSSFELGRNLAVTPSKVVFRNDLMELLQYEPQTDQVHSTPMLCSPPWINKYYIMDLAPKRSFIEWAVQHGRTVFAISYRNPTAEMAKTTMADYLISGPKQALDVISEITGSPKIDMVGLCLGGALTAITAAYLSQTGDDRLGSVTLLNTMLDYSNPGPIAAFTDAAAIDKVEKEMAKAGGTLPGKSMAGTFDVLRANDLIFNYVVSNWLLGQQPPAFDILAWNNDHTGAAGTVRDHASMDIRTLHRKAEAVLRAQLLCQEPARPGQTRARGADDRPERGEVERLHRRRRERPHRAVAGGVQDHRAVLRPHPVHAQQRRAHRGNRQPAGPQSVVHGARRQPLHPRRVARGRQAHRRLLVDRLDPLGR